MDAAPRRGRPPTTDRDSVVSAALVVIERDGLDGLTMRSVASELGVGHATVHRYVDGREQLVALVLDGLQHRLPSEIVDQVDAVATWQDGVMLWAIAAFRQATSHPGALELLVRSRFIPDAPETHRLIDRIAQLSESDGTDLGLVRTALGLANDTALGLAALESARDAASGYDRIGDDISTIGASYPAAGRLLRAPASALTTEDRLRIAVGGITRAVRMGEPA